MESDIKITPDKIPSDSPLETPASSPLTPSKKSRNYWKISTIVLLIAFFLAGLLFLLFSRKDIDQQTEAPQTLQPSTETTKSNQIRISNIIFTYPDNWVPIFADPKTGNNLIYFANSQSDAESTTTKCADKENCEDYTFKLESLVSGIPQNSSIEDFVKNTMHEIEIDKLQKTTINGHNAWSGYLDDQKRVYQLIIDTSSGQIRTFSRIIATATENGQAMMTQYVSSTPNIKVIDTGKNIEAKDLTTKNAFEIELTSSLTTQDYFLLTSILDSFLSPSGSTKYYNYFLYSSVGSSENNVGVLGYPKGDYLNYKYYLLTDNDKLKDGEYGTQQIKIKLSTPDISNLGVFLADPKYCQQDSDCSYHGNFCTMGAFNQYHAFYTPWGCGPPDYEGIGNSEALIMENGCQQNIKVEYDSLKCINSSCQAINPKLVCNP